MNLDQTLASIGVNIASSGIYDVAKQYFASTTTPNREDLAKTFVETLHLQNVDVAGRIIEALAQHGDIVIEGSRITATNSITMASTQGTKFIFGNNSKSSNGSSSIVAGTSAYIVGSGNAKITQHDNGDISFHA